MTDKKNPPPPPPQPVSRLVKGICNAQDQKIQIPAAEKPTTPTKKP